MYDAEQINPLISLANSIRVAYAVQLVPPIVLIAQGDTPAAALLPFPLIGFVAVCMVRWRLQLVNMLIYWCVFLGIRGWLFTRSLRHISRQSTDTTNDYTWLGVQTVVAVVFEMYIAWIIIRFIQNVRSLPELTQLLLRWKPTCR